MASIAAASVLVGKIDPGLNLSHRVFDETHSPLAMTALVRRRRLQGLHRGSERGQGALHIALIGQGRRRCERQSGRGGDAGGGYQKKIAAAGSGSHCFLFLLVGAEGSVPRPGCPFESTADSLILKMS